LEGQCGLESNLHKLQCMLTTLESQNRETFLLVRAGEPAPVPEIYTTYAYSGTGVSVLLQAHQVPHQVPSIPSSPDTSSSHLYVPMPRGLSALAMNERHEANRGQGSQRRPL
jgi:hypothetical protein